MKFLSGRIAEKILLQAGWIAFFLILWILVVRIGDLPPVIFPSPREVVSSLYKEFSEGSLWFQILASILLVITGLVIGIAFAFLMLLLSIFSRAGKSLVTTLTSIFHPLAGIALLPVIILWFGTGAVSVIFIIVHSVIWPMTTNMIAGSGNIPDTFLMVGRNYQLTRFQIFYKIVIPGSSPYILAGLKISWARAWRALISAEMIFGAVFGSGGMGWFIFSRRVFMDTPGMFAGIVVVVIIGILVEDGLFRLLENRTVQRWGMSV